METMRSSPALGTVSFGNQGNDLISTRGIYDIFPRDNSTVAGGQGDDHIVDGSLAQPTSGASVLQGNEDNDTIAGTGGVDTITGGDGRDVFEYLFSSDDGNNAAGGGPIERITDLNWAEDRFDVGVPVTFATDMTGRTTGPNLAAQADSAIAGAFALAGADPLERVAVQFAFNGRAYLAVDSAFGGVEGRFDDRDDVLLDITGVVGTISAGGFTFS
jgi:Ca2+-binding RTX toxin-like protein